MEEYASNDLREQVDYHSLHPHFVILWNCGGRKDIKLGFITEREVKPAIEFLSSTKVVSSLWWSCMIWPLVFLLSTINWISVIIFAQSDVNVQIHSLVLNRGSEINLYHFLKSFSMVNISVSNWFEEAALPPKRLIF